MHQILFRLRHYTGEAYRLPGCISGAAASKGRERKPQREGGGEEIEFAAMFPQPWREIDAYGKT